jgi:hypothetical protein
MRHACVGGINFIHTHNDARAQSYTKGKKVRMKI